MLILPWRDSACSLTYRLPEGPTKMPFDVLTGGHAQADEPSGYSPT